MSEERNWGAEPEREPKPQPSQTPVYSEHGRILNNIDYRSHWFMVVKGYAGHALLVSHGAGQEEYHFFSGKGLVQSLELLTSDQRYLVLHGLWNAYKDGRNHGANDTATEYRQAFIDGRLKKRKLPAQRMVKVWIERKPITQEARA